MIIAQLNREVEKRQVEYIHAQMRDDKQAMQRAAEEAADLRKAGATLAFDQDTELTQLLKQYYERPSIKQALSSGSLADLNQACNDADRYFIQASVKQDQVHMEAAAQLFINLRLMGATDSSGGVGPLTVIQKMMIEAVVDFTPHVGDGISLTVFIADDMSDGQKLSDLEKTYLHPDKSKELDSQ